MFKKNVFVPVTSGQFYIARVHKNKNKQRKMILQCHLILFLWTGLKIKKNKYAKKKD